MTYIYVCTKCKHEFEESRKVDDRDNPSKCPKCKKKAKRIEIPMGSKIAHHYRATGFFSTDYKKRNVH